MGVAEQKELGALLPHRILERLEVDGIRTVFIGERDVEHLRAVVFHDLFEGVVDRLLDENAVARLGEGAGRRAKTTPGVTTYQSSCGRHP